MLLGLWFAQNPCAVKTQLLDQKLGQEAASSIFKWGNQRSRMGIDAPSHGFPWGLCSPLNMPAPTLHLGKLRLRGDKEGLKVTQSTGDGSQARHWTDTAGP